MEPNQSGVKTWQWVVTVVVIIALIIIGVLVFGGKSSTNTDTDGTETPTTEPSDLANGANRINVTDQYPGNVVYISSVQLANPGWVAIHKDNNGVPGAVIGSSKFAAGINSGNITVSEPIVDGGTYYAIIHTDDGDSRFDATKDLPLKDENGSVVMKIFRGSASAGAGLKD